MKTYEEMAQSALARGKAIRKERKVRNARLLKGFAGLAACCLVVVLFFGTGRTHDDPSPIGPVHPESSEGPNNFGTIGFLTEIHKTDTTLTGQSFQYIAGDRAPSILSPAPPWYHFDTGSSDVVAKAVEECTGIYETLNEYGSTKTNEYRLFRMEVIDPLESGMEGSFYYLLPKHLKGDLTQYDALLISPVLLPRNYVLRCGGELVAFEFLFADANDQPELGNIIAFTDGIFDESMWQDKSWSYGYQFARSYLDMEYGNLLVSRGSTLEEALRRREAQGPFASVTVGHDGYQTEEAQKVMEYLKPFENGIFVPERNCWGGYRCRRYINGCPTNEWVCVERGSETVTASEHRFEDADFENLPNLSQYIAGLDLTQFTPLHTDITGKKMSYNSAVGWYEKTDSGVYSIVRIAWQFWEWYEYEHYTAVLEYYDETFILLDETGDHIISREELTELIGQNRNIYYGEYGVGKEKLE